MKKKLVKFIILLILVISIEPIQADAGSGTYNNGTPNALTLNVLFNFDISPDFKPSSVWEGVFNRASELLYNATNGQLQIGTINFYDNCPEMIDKADIIIHSGSGGASAHVGGFGTNGQHVFIYNDRHSQDQASARGHFGIVHELGHYVFGLYDSYEDSRGNPSSCISDSSTVATIMDGGTTVQPNNQRTEWALPMDEASCRNTAQFEKRHMVDWPWIVQYVEEKYNATLTQPNSYETTMPSVHQSLTFNYYECKLRAIVCIDRSGSMGNDNKMAKAQVGAKLFTDLTKPSDQLGVSSFSSSPSIDYAIAAMNSTNKDDAKSAIDSLLADGQTDIGGGLQTSLDMISYQGAQVSNEVIILLSDGQHNTGTYPDSVIPALKSRGVVVYTIGLGSDADAGLLSNIANETGGNYFFAANTSRLTAHFNSIFTQVRNDGSVVKMSENVAAGGTVSHPVDIDVYTGVGGEATFVLSWSSGNLDFTLVRPDSTVVNTKDADVSYYVQEGTSVLYRMSNPSVGRWNVIISSGSTATSYDLQVNSTSKSNVSVVTTTDKGLYLSGELINITTSVLAPPRGTLEGQAVSGALVTGNIKLDGALVGTITLYDDGEESHGDKRRDDGIYSIIYNPSNSGNYTFEITTTNTTGKTAPPDEEDPTWVSKPIDPFTRMSETTVVVELSTSPTQQPLPGGGGTGLGVALVVMMMVIGGVSILVISQRKKKRSKGYLSSGHTSLYFRSGPLAGQRVMVSSDFSIGRSRSCKLQISDKSVSQVHARIRFARGEWYIQDQNSSGGTYVDGQRITATILRQGSQIRIGNTIFTFEVIRK